MKNTQIGAVTLSCLTLVNVLQLSDPAKDGLIIEEPMAIQQLFLQDESSPSVDDSTQPNGQVNKDDDSPDKELISSPLNHGGCKISYS